MPDCESRPRPFTEEVIDLTEHMGIDDFDLVVRAIDDCVDRSTSLCLDDEADRKTLKARLLVALGGVPVDKKDLRL